MARVRVVAPVLELTFYTSLQAARRAEDDAIHIAKTVAENYGDDEIRGVYLETAIDLYATTYVNEYSLARS